MRTVLKAAVLSLERLVEAASVAVAVVDDKVVFAHEQLTRDPPALKTGASAATGTG